MSQAAPTPYLPWRCRGTRAGHRCREVLGRIVAGVLRFEQADGAAEPGGAVALVCPACHQVNIWQPGTATAAPVVT